MNRAIRIAALHYVGAILMRCIMYGIGWGDHIAGYLAMTVVSVLWGRFLISELEFAAGRIERTLYILTLYLLGSGIIWPVIGFIQSEFF